MELNVANVRAIMMDCIPNEQPDVKVEDAVPVNEFCSTLGDYTLVYGISSSFGFTTAKINEHKEDIHSMLKQLHPTFQHDNGGGWSFIYSTQNDKEDTWGGQNDSQALMCLGIAAGVVTVSLPREMWSALPGSVPYFSVSP